MEERNMDMKIVGITVAILVSITVLAGVLMPVLDDATATTDTFTNEGYYRMSESSETSVITWDPSVNKDVVNINGTDISLAGLPTGTYSVAFADDIIVRFSNQDTYNFQLWNSSYATGLGGTSTYKAIVTISTDNIKFKTSNPESVEQTITHSGEYFIIDPDGDYIMKDKSKSAYLLKDSSIFYGGGISAIVGSTYSGFYLEGTVEDCTVTPMSSSVTVSDVVCDYTDSSDHINMVTLDKVTFTSVFTAQDSTTTEKSQAYNYFLVPYEITAERVVHFTDNQNALLAVIPMLVIVALLIGVVALVIRSRLD